MTVPDLTREDLIALCERGIVHESKWLDRDSAGAQAQLGKAWALLRAGCDFEFSTDPCSNDRTVWIDVTFRGFDAFELGNEYRVTELFYIPTAARLDAAAGGDWY